MNRMALLCVVIFFFTACSNDGCNDLPCVYGYGEELTNGYELQFDSFYMLPWECTDKSLVSEIRKIDFIDSLIVVQTPERVLSFDRSGKFMHTYGSRGNGEAEYVSATVMAVDRTQEYVYVFDSFTNRALAYTVKGKFISARKYKGSFFSLIQNCEFINSETLFCSKCIFNDINTVYAEFCLKTGKHVDLYHFPAESDNTEESIGIHPFSIYADTLRCIVPFSNSLFVYTGDTLKPYLEVKTNNQLIVQGEIENIKDFNIMTYSKLMSENKFVGFSSLFENQNYMFASFFNMNYFL